MEIKACTNDKNCSMIIIRRVSFLDELLARFFKQWLVVLIVLVLFKTTNNKLFLLKIYVGLFKTI
ncbi:hypothetical protein GCM10009410_16150 [Shewanella ulleungensis]|uniref:Uncharacterized protein n=1 Tax=Shewanella ulleungensis TaxID=2282699 RepID=A0ABQ2QJM0_9GAMM|nr:hypothetical protein GCM10009410_16150 [Shewanella ulleungensis]